MIKERLYYLRDMLDGKLKLNQSIDIHQFIATLDAVIKELEDKNVI